MQEESNPKKNRYDGLSEHDLNKSLLYSQLFLLMLAFISVEFSFQNGFLFFLFCTGIFMRSWYMVEVLPS